MPNGRTHDFITVVTGAAGAPLALNSGLPDMGPTNAMVLVGTYLVSGLLFSPDLDLRSKSYRRWRMLRFIWIPYQKMVPHRSWISHSMVAGPLLRVLYFAGMLSLISLIVLGLLNLAVPIDPTGLAFEVTATVSQWVQTHPAVIGYTVLGFVLGGAAHSFTDSIWSAIRRRF